MTTYCFIFPLPDFFLAVSHNIAHFVHDCLNDVKKVPYVCFNYAPILVSRTLPERIVLSRKIAEAFVKINSSGHTIRPVPGDGYCIIPAFRENLLSAGCKVTFDDLTTCLRSELQSDKYQTCNTDDINIVNEPENNLEDTLSQYSKVITDLSLDALGMVLKVNNKILKSDCSDFDQVNTSS